MSGRKVRYHLAMDRSISEYNEAQSAADRTICELLCREIDSALPGATSKIWHGSPVWFLEGNPIVGYHKLKTCVRLLFWSGQSFNENGLVPEGSFKAAEVRFQTLEDVDTVMLKLWLAKSREIQWDYKNIVKRKGQLVGLKGQGVANEESID